MRTPGLMPKQVREDTKWGQSRGPRERVTADHGPQAAKQGGQRPTRCPFRLQEKRKLLCGSHPVFARTEKGRDTLPGAALGRSRLLWGYFGPIHAPWFAQMNRLLTGDWGEEFPLRDRIICNPRHGKALVKGVEAWRKKVPEGGDEQGNQ